MKINKAFLLSTFIFFQCINENTALKNNFVFLKKDNNAVNTYIHCQILPIEGDVDMTHYKIFGFSFNGNKSKGVLKVAKEKKSNRLVYEQILTPKKGISLNDIYMTDKNKNNFTIGKKCEFKILYDDKEEINFEIKKGINYKIKNQKEVYAVIFVEYQNERTECKISQEIPLGC